MEEIHTLTYFGKGGYTIDPWDLTGREREWLLERLNKQYEDDEKAFDQAMKGK